MGLVLKCVHVTKDDMGQISQISPLGFMLFKLLLRLPALCLEDLHSGISTYQTGEFSNFRGSFL